MRALTVVRTGVGVWRFTVLEYVCSGVGVEVPTTAIASSSSIGILISIARSFSSSPCPTSIDVCGLAAIGVALEIALDDFTAGLVLASCSGVLFA